ncbi:MAG TPA: purine-binding chemotaxis protein CheW [Gammaproteobacteria bacterium]|nr:purine-binding chemotaxis protein CheW [Gammaproteobacteria bacterium]
MYLLFAVADERFGINVAEVVEVIPWVPLQRMPQAPACVAGIFSYRGTAVPVVDLSCLLAEQPSTPLLSTRIVLVRRPGPGAAMLGLVAERVTETVKFKEGDFIATGEGESGFAGKLAMDEAGIIRCLDLSELLPREALARFSGLNLEGHGNTRGAPT